METLQVAGVILFIFGILTASSMLREGKHGLPEEHLAEAQRIERMTIVNALGPLLPLIAALGFVSAWQNHAAGIGVSATLLTTTMLALRGVVHARRMRGAGVPEAYSLSYRNAHAIRATALAICALALISAA